MNRDSNLYVQKFGKKEAKLAQSISAKKVFYEYNGDGSQLKIESEKKTISDNSADYFNWQEEVINQVTLFVGKKLAGTNRDNNAFREYLISFLRSNLSADIRLMWLAREDTNAIVQVDFPSIISKMYIDRVIIGNEHSSYLKILKQSILSTLYFMRWPLNLFRKKIISKHLLIPCYEFVQSNAEFFSLYNVLDDSVVLVSRKSELHNYLSTLNRDLVLKSNLYTTPKQFLFLLIECGKLLTTIGKFRSPLLIYGVFSYIKEYSKIFSYFNLVDVRHIGIVRGDTYCASSLLRVISSNLGITTYSWSHAVYFYREDYLSSVNYDWYGISGHNEKDVYSELWSKDTKYVQIGQITYDYRESRVIDIVEKYNDQQLDIVCVYPTTVKEQVTPNTPSNFMEFIDAVCTSCVGDSNLLVLYKSKNNLKLVRNDKVDDTQLELEYSAIEQMSKNITSKFSLLDQSISVYDTYDYVDIGYVYSMSTVAFELIQNKKKVLVYWPFESNAHPFSLYTPLLVASCVNDFSRKSKILREMKYSEYKEYIVPTLEYCLVSRPSGNTVSRFIKMVECN